jgi:hypothetical protein
MDGRGDCSFGLASQEKQDKPGKLNTLPGVVARRFPDSSVSCHTPFALFSAPSPSHHSSIASRLLYHALPGETSKSDFC